MTSQVIITLEDFEKRYDNLRKQYPKIKKCTVAGCKNPRDITKLLGWSSSCAYHRLLFDFWGMETLSTEKMLRYVKHQKGRRRAFSNWMRKTGKEECDRIVLEMAQEPINWEC